MCFVLGLGSMLFSRDAHNIVLLPLERIIKRVKDIAENPLMQQVKLDLSFCFLWRVLIERRFDNIVPVQWRI